MHALGLVSMRSRIACEQMIRLKMAYSMRRFLWSTQYHY